MKNQFLNSLVLALFPIAILFVTFYKADFKALLKGQANGAQNKDSTFLTQSRLIRASACLFVIIHHLAQFVTNYGFVWKGPVTVFSYMGILFTAIFFFYSGYGLLVSVHTKPEYLRHFFSNRILSVLIPFWIANLAITILDVILGGSPDPGNLLKELLGLRLINGNGWFIIEIVLFYIIFFVLFSIIRNKDIALVLMSICVVLVIVFSFFMGHEEDNSGSRWFMGEWWFNSTLTFVFGMLYARFQKSWDEFFEKHYRVLLPVGSAVFVLLFTASIYANNHLGYYHELSLHGRRDALITLLLQTLTCIVFALVILLFGKKITLGNRALGFVSSMSLELFLIHGFFVNFFFIRKNLPDPLLFAAVFICSLPLAYLLSLLDAYLIDRERSFFKNLEDTKKKKRTAIILVSVVILLSAALSLFAGRHYLLAKQQFENELAILRTSDVGDEVEFGHFETKTILPGDEHLSWIIIKKDGDTLRLLTKYAIAGSFYNQKHTEVSWQSSDLYKLLNSKESLGAFSKYEAAILLPDPETGEIISLLTPKDAKELFHSDKERELSVTQAARASGTNENQKSKYNEWDMKGYRTCWWWLKGSNEPSIYAPIVTEDGEILEDTNPVPIDFLLYYAGIRFLSYPQPVDSGSISGLTTYFQPRYA